ncbi:MAG: hypothetical protein ACK5JD_00850 [Mangrovibacterium sp.]
MKKLLLIACVAMLTACQQGKIDRMQSTQDSLASVAAEKDAAILDFVSAMTEIQENLDSIKHIQNIVQVESAAVSEGQIKDKDKIMNDIQVIADLMQKNREMVDKLQKQLGASNSKVAELQRAIAVLNRQIEQKDAEIATLQAELAKLNINVSELNTRMNEMSAESMHKDEVIQEKSTTIESQTIAMNKAFYAFGTQKELIENDLVEKDGGFLGLGRTLKMKEDFNKAYFTEIDIREFAMLELHVKKAALITTHPAGSYHFEGDKTVESFVIDDPKEFWKTSKYLIIEVN